MKRITGLLLTAILVCSRLDAQITPEVRKISFSGAHAFPDELLRAAIISNQTGCTFRVICGDKQYLDPVGLRGDLVRLRLFYYQRGYRHARIELDTIRAAARMNVRFKVTEGEPVRVATLEVRGFETARLPLAVGQPFSLIDYELSRDSLRARLENMGFARAEVLANYTIPRDSASIAHVEFEVLTGDRVRFGDIAIAGNDEVSTNVVRRMLSFGTGDVYSYDDVLRSQRNLFGLETFRHVEIKADVNAATDTMIPVTVQVNEGNLHRVRAGVGMSTSEYINAEGTWASRNFLGGARRLEFRARIYNLASKGLRYLPFFDDTGRPYNDLSGSASIDFSQPWFFDPQNNLNAGVYAERKSLPNIFVRTARGGYLTMSRSLGPGETFSFGYRPELTELSAGGDLVFCVNFLTCGADEIKVLREPHWLSPFALTYGRDRANNLFWPNGGYSFHFDGEYAAQAIGSDFSYARVISELTHYQKIGSGSVLATRLRPGFARALGEPAEGLGLHPQKRFFGGGANSVRGFAQFRMGPKILTTDALDFLTVDSIPGHCTAAQVNAGTCNVGGLVEGHEFEFVTRPVGGEAILEGNLELRVPFFWEKLRAAAFLDFGQVWRQSKDVSLSDVVFTPGFGFRYFSAIGPVRVDIGYNPKPSERLEVVTTKVVDTGTGLERTNELVSLGTVLWNANPSWRDHIQLHFSIGQAF
ncbi:MAG TPA: BamA/TamA family outer membrane protein [Longimicrobiales bacterium]|nr:BamA/TamA family outer membrane protein [Longimicrobiales bacterium]